MADKVARPWWRKKRWWAAGVVWHLVVVLTTLVFLTPPIHRVDSRIGELDCSARKSEKMLLHAVNEFNNANHSDFQILHYFLAGSGFVIINIHILNDITIYHYRQKPFFEECFLNKFSIDPHILNVSTDNKLNVVKIHGGNYERNPD